MAYPKEILDGSMSVGTYGAAGSGTVSIAGQTYIVESETLTPNWTTAEARGSTGRINRKRSIKQPFTLALKLQLANSSVPYPPAGSQFTWFSKQTGVGTLNFYVKDVPEERNNEENFIESVSITAEEVLNTGNFTVVTS